MDAQQSQSIQTLLEAAKEAAKIVTLSDDSDADRAFVPAEGKSQSSAEVEVVEQPLAGTSTSKRGLSGASTSSAIPQRKKGKATAETSETSEPHAKGDKGKGEASKQTKTAEETPAAGSSTSAEELKNLRRALDQIAPGIAHQVATTLNFACLQDSGIQIQMLRYMASMAKLQTEAVIHNISDASVRNELLAKLNDISAPEIPAFHTVPLSHVWGMAGSPTLAMAALSSQVSWVARELKETVPTFGAATDSRGNGTDDIDPAAPRLPFGFQRADKTAPVRPASAHDDPDKTLSVPP